MDPEMVESPAKPPNRAAPYCVPRRFGIGTILVVTTAFAGLLAFLRWFGAPPQAVGFLLGYISLVGLGQAVLFRGCRPRLASIATGSVCMLLLVVVVMAFNRTHMPVPRRGFSMSRVGSLV